MFVNSWESSNVQSPCPEWFNQISKHFFLGRRQKCSHWWYVKYGDKWKDQWSDFKVILVLMRLSIPQIRFVVHTVEFSNYLPRARNWLSSAHSGAGPQLTPWCNRCTSKPGNEADMCVDSIRVSKLEWNGFERLTVQWVRSRLDGHSQRCGHSSMSRWTCNHRAVQVGCDLCRTSAPAFLLKQGHTEEDSQDHLQMLYEDLWVGRLYNPFWHPVPVLQQLHSPELLPNVQMEPPLLQFVPCIVCSCIGTGMSLDSTSLCTHW